MSYDVSFAPNEDDTALIAHRPDCPDVRAQADRGEPVATMLGCEAPLPPEIEWHDCPERV